jgi:2-(1,2-epoxy-1,2-dihydrophenyl)acetyl-CoA isomerase
MNQTVLAEARGETLFLTLNRPEDMNAVDVAMSERMAELGEALPRLAADTRVIVLRGAGRSFMAGGDIQGFQANMPRIDSMLHALIDGFHVFVQALADAPQPVLCAVQGAAAGGGLSLAVACDLVVAADDAKFALAYRKLGTSTDGGATYSLPRMIGQKRAMEMLLLSDRLTAAEALELGIVNRVVPPAQLEAETAHLAARLAANSAVANASMKRLLNASYHHTLPEQLAMERDRFVAGSTGPDFAEGVAAFLEKRAPRFEARSPQTGELLEKA